MASKLFTSPTTTRWGLLITTIALALVLVGTGLAGYLGAREAFRSVARARGLDMVMAVRREMRQSTADHQVVLETVLVDMESQGLRYLGLIKRRGGLIAAAGTPSEPLQIDSLRQRPRGREPEVQVVGRNIRVVVPFGPGPRAGRRGPPPGGERATAPSGEGSEVGAGTGARTAPRSSPGAAVCWCWSMSRWWPGPSPAALWRCS